MQMNDRTKLANIYIYNAIQYVRKIKYSIPYDEEPDERFMRTLEEHAGIAEVDVTDWRARVHGQLAELRMDYCYRALGTSFDWYLESNMAEDILKRYKSVLPIYGDVLIEYHETEHDGSHGLGCGLCAAVIDRGSIITPDYEKMSGIAVDLKDGESVESELSELHEAS